MRIKLMIIFLVIVFLSFSVSAQDLKVALVSDIGGFEDYSYNDQLKKSLELAAEKYDFTLELKESEIMSKYLNDISYFAENNFDLIFGVSFTMKEAVKEAAQIYPENQFVIFDAVVEEENVNSLIFKKAEAGFLAGITAALETKTKAVAFIGAENNEKINNYQRGFITGVKNVDSELEVFSKYLGSFNDFSKAKMLSEELRAKNVDIIFYAAGAASKGIIEAALEKDIKLISLDCSDIKLAPNNILTVISKNTDQIIEELITDYQNKNFESKIREYGIAEGAFILDKKQSDKLISEETLLKIREYQQQYISGEIEILSQTQIKN